MTKKCTNCSKLKSVKLFYKCKNGKHGVGSWCKECYAPIYKKYRKKNKKARNSYLLTMRYGISQDEYENLLSQQGEVCLICEQKCKTGRNLAIDHNHETGKIRGLLCSKCNRGLGLFNNNIVLLLEAVQYLRLNGEYDVSKSR